MTEPITIQSTTDPDALHAASELRISLFRLIRRLRTEHPTGLRSFAQMAVLMRIYRHGPATLSELAAAGASPRNRWPAPSASWSTTASCTVKPTPPTAARSCSR